MPTKTVTAGILIIGNEILSGRTLDTNTNTIAKELTNTGIRLMEVQTIPDDLELIETRLNDFRKRFDYVFTSGGIGPTHDDKTAQAIANAFGKELVLNKQAYDLLLAHYGAETEMNEGRTKMAYLPEGAKLIHNPVSAAPGIHMENVYVLAGVPSIMKAMLDSIIPTLQTGSLMHSENVVCDSIPESVMAPHLEEIENRYSAIEIGSYPRYKDGTPSLSVVVRSTDKVQLAKAVADVRVVLADLN
jgi:molybdenum cofactor synthesis domain-containing protein